MPCSRSDVLERIAVGVRAVPQLVLVVHRPRGGARAEQAAAEPRALLVGPVDEANSDWRIAVARDAAEHLGGRDEVQHPVEPAAVGDRVDVAADEHGAIRLPPQRPPLVAGLVGLVLERQLVELASEPVLGANPGLGPGHALRAVLVARQLA